MKRRREPQGCLTLILGLIGLRIPPEDVYPHDETPEQIQDLPPDHGDPAVLIGKRRLPYRLRDDFLSRAERSFFGVLLNVVAGRALVFAKVRVADLLYVPRSGASLADLNRISAKHVDFVLCAPDTLRPLAAVELDDASHGRADRVGRDEFLDEAFRAADLPLLRFPVRRHYDLREVAIDLEQILNRSAAEIPAKIDAGTDEVPNCPKCGREMVLRTAAKGHNRGENFFGCPDYPRCRGIVRVI